jgi:hypothetical protein
MPLAKPSDVMRKWFEEVWCRSRGDQIAEMFAEDGLAHGLGAEPVKGPAAFREFWKRFNEIFKNIRIEVRGAVDEGEQCYVRCTGRMTFRDKPVVLDGGCLATVRGGKIREVWNLWDFLGLLVSMEALPPDAVERAFGGQKAAFDPSTGLGAGAPPADVPPTAA